MKKQHCFIVEGEKIIAAIIPIEDYDRYEEIIEDFELLTVAVNRMQNADFSKTTTYEDILEELGKCRGRY